MDQKAIGMGTAATRIGRSSGAASGVKLLREKWTEVFEDPSLTMASLKARALSQHSNLGTDGIRSVCWKVYLSCLPSLELSTWPFAMTKERERYMQLRKQYIRAIGSEEGSEPDLEVNNPLSLAEDSPWQQFFVDSELKKIIKQDVERTLPDNDYFRSERVQEQLSDILFIYCKINHDVSYRQGMHELLAHVLWVVSSESLDIHSEPGMTSDATLEVIKSVLDSTYIEHDTFSLFSSLMSRAKPWYEFSEEGFPGRKSKPTNVPQTQLFGRSETPEQQPAGKQTPVIEWSFKIFHQLEKIDNELYLHLRSLEIEPQLFGIRWFRLLFSREFPMDNVLSLWDGIFANGPSLDICIFLGVALLLRIRDELLEEDFAGCLHKLMRYPSVKDIHQFLPQALRLQKSPNAASGQEVIRQNYALAGKPLPPLPPAHADVDHPHSGRTSPSYSQRQSPSHHHAQAQYHYQHPQAHSHDQSKGSAFSGNGVLSQHLPPAALDAIKPVAEGFVHVTKNVLESKGGAALNKAISDMKKNTQSYIRKANTHTPPPAPSTFPPMFDQAISSTGRMAATSRPAPSPPKHHHAHGSISDANKQFQSQLGQIVAKAVVILDAEFISPSRTGAGTPNNSDSNRSTTGDEKEPVKEPSKAALAAMCGLEHVRDALLGFVKELDPLVIESAMLEKPAQIPTTKGAGNHYHTPVTVNQATPQAEGQVAESTSPVPRTLPHASTTANSPSGQLKKGVPARSSMDITHERRSLSRTSSQANVATESSLQHGATAVSPASICDSAPTVPVQTTPPPPPKPFSFDDLIKDTPAEPTRSSSPLSSGSRGASGAGLRSKTKSPRSSLAHSQFSWMLNDGAEDGTQSGPAASRTGSAGVASSSSSTSLSSATKGSNGGGTSRPLGEFTLASSPSLGGHRVKVDPLAGSVSKRSGPGAQQGAGSRTGAGLSTLQGQQLQDDDPLRE
ncbi:TBC1 domain, member 5 [Mortierella alpina]|nr:TBC1 domain, member 5 [Mortierella alpina]